MAEQRKNGNRQKTSLRRPSHAVLTLVARSARPTLAAFVCSQATSPPTARACVCARRRRLRESMGVGADSTQKAFYSTDIAALLARPRVTIERSLHDRNMPCNTNHILVAVDPSGGGSSAFAVTSVAQLPSGQVVVRAS